MLRVVRVAVQSEVVQYSFTIEKYSIVTHNSNAIAQLPNFLQQPQNSNNLTFARMKNMGWIYWEVYEKLWKIW